MTSLARATLAVAVFGRLTPALAQQTLTLAADGRSDYVVVRPADSSPSQLYAAEELVEFTRQMTSVELPVVTDEAPLPAKAILLGVTRYTAELLGAAPDLTALGDDGFRLVARPPHLLIVGSGVRGTLYGVYELLERHGGCRWFAPWQSTIPHRPTWTIPAVDDTQVPAFAMREPFWWPMFPGDYAARCRANGNRMELEARHGGKIRFGGGLFVHTFYPLMPPAEFFATHPEYYSEINGKRTADYAQLCLSNPDVVRIVTERVLERIRRDPEAKLFSVSQNDWGGWCQCERCRAIDEREGSPAGSIITFVNQVAEAVEKEFPNVWIETLAYQYSRTPPRTVRPRANVVPRLCTIECDFSRPLDQSDYPQNVRFVDDIKGWSAITDKLYIWDYTTNFGHYLAPHPNFGALQGNVQFFRDNHVVGLFEQGAYQGPHAEFAELRGWLLAKLLWNPDQPVEPLIDEFMTGYYGPAAGPVRTYFDELQALVADPSAKLFIWGPPTAPCFTDAFFERAAGLWAEAERLAADDPQYRYNVRMSALPVIYARLMRWPAMKISREWRDGILAPVGVDPEYAALAKEFLARLEEGKITHISESRERHEQYCAQLRGQVEGYRGIPLVAGELRAAVVPETGGQVVELAGPDGVNVIAPGSGGIDFADATVGLGGQESAPYQVVSSGQAEVELKRSVRDRYTIDRTVTLADGRLRVDHTITGKGSVRPVLRAALATGEGVAAATDPDAPTWIPIPVPADQTTAYASLSAAQVAGHRLLVGATSGRGVELTLPEDPVDRVWIVVDAVRGTTRVHVALAPTDLVEGQPLKVGLTLRPVTLAAAPEVSVAAEHRPDRLVVEECMAGLGRVGEWGDIVADPEAEDGYATKLYNTHYEWCVQWHVDPELLVPGATYRLRMRVKVEKGDHDGKAFWAGVYDTVRKSGFGGIDPLTSAVEDGYQWYDVATWTPEAGQYVWIGPGVFDKAKGETSAVQAVYLDRFELIRVE